MSHHRSSDSHSKTEKSEINPEISQEKPAHPFLESKDMVYFSILMPFLTPRAQKMLNFMINLGDDNRSLGLLDLSDLMKRFTSRNGDSPLTELLPTLMNMLSNTDSQSKINPALINTLMSAMTNINNKTEE